MTDPRWIIVGGGISALSAAEQLHARGESFVLLEKKPRLGGWLETERVDGFQLEWGPNSFQASAQPLFDFLDRLSGDVDSLVSRAAPAARYRYIVRGGKLRALPTGLSSFFTTRALSLWGKFRIACEPLVRSRSKAGETVAEFVRRRFGSDALNYLVSPFVSGIYGGLPAELELRAAFPRLAEFENAGSVMQGALRSQKKARQTHADRAQGDVRRGIYSVTEGMACVAELAQQRFGEHVRLGAEVTRMRYDAKQKGWRLRYECDGVESELKCKRVVLATPAPVTAQLLEPELEGVHELLDPIKHASIAVVHVGVPPQELTRPLDGFGFLVPRRESTKILGAIWSSTLFPHRAPEGQALISVFMGGRGSPEVAALSEERLRHRALEGLFEIFGGGFSPTLVRARVMHHCIPQYDVGHLQRIADLRTKIASVEGLSLCGSYLDGVSVSQCVESGQRSVSVAD